MQSSTLVKVEVKDPKPTTDVVYTSDIPITKRAAEKKPEIKKLVNHNFDPSLEPVTKVKLVTDPYTGDDGELGEDPVPIGQEDGLEDIEPLDFVLLERIAVPASCEGLATRDEKVKCMNAWIGSYLSQNLKYPSQASRMNLTDKVYLSFVVDSDGKITEVEVLKGEYDILNEEAMRAIELMPDWIPGKQFNKNVPMRMRIPVNFTRR